MSRLRAIRRIAGWGLGILLVLLVLLAGLLAWVTATEPGTRWAVSQARPFLPAGIEFERVEGVLIGPITITGLRVETPAAGVGVDRIELDWSPAALFHTEVRVTRLAVRGIDVELRQTAGGDGDPGGGFRPEALWPPVRVVLEQLQVDEIAVRLPDVPVQRVQSVRLGAAVGPEGLRIDRLELAAPQADLSGSLRIDGGGGFAVEGDLDWALRPPEPRLAPLAGRLRLGGSLRRTQVDLQVRAPGALRLRAEVRALAEEPSWSGRLRLAPTRLDQWWSEAPPLTAGARLQLDGTLAQAMVDGSGTLEGLEAGPLELELAGRASADEVVVRRLRVVPAQRPSAHLEARGTLELAGDAPRLDAHLQWRDLAWPLAGAPLATSEAGSARVEGLLDDYRLSVDARLRTPQTGSEPIRARLRASGSSRALTGIELAADWHEAALQVDGEVRWAPAGEARLRLALDRLDPSRLEPRLDGMLDARGTVELGWGERIDGRLALESVSGVLNGRPLSGMARLRHAGGTTTVETVSLDAAGGTLRARGEIGAQLAVDWRVELPDLSALLPDWSGEFRGSGEVSGPAGQPSVALALTAHELAVPGVSIDVLAVTGSLAPLGGAETSLRVEAGTVVTEWLTVDSASARLRGTPAEHRLTAALAGDRGELELELRGGLAGSDWSGRLHRARVAPAERAPWQLQEPAALTWEQRRLQLSLACWRSDDGRLCLAGGGGPADWQASLNASGLPLALVASQWRDDLDFEGTFGIELALAAADGPVTGQARLELQPGRVRGVIDEQPETLLEFDASVLEARLDTDRVELDATLELAGEDAVRLRTGIGRDAPRGLSGRLQARLQELGLVTVLVPEVGRIDGVLLADLEFGGRLDNPTVGGSVTLASGRVEVLPLGIELTDLEADLVTRARAMQLDLGASSGGGRLAVRAELEYGERQWRGSGRITGIDFEAVALPELALVASPEIDWQLEGRDLSLRGEVVVPSARIAPRDLANTVQSSPDAVVVGEAAQERPEPERPLRVTADIAVELGPEVELDAFGLEGRLEGGIRVLEQPDQATTGTGELRVADGSYSIYRQTLEIQRGRVLFDGGPVANPGLDVRAVRRPRGVVVGVNVRGRLREPEVTLFSEPSMPESEQLSYLLFGVPLGRTSEGQQSSLASAAAALATTDQGTRLASTVGIQEVEVDQAGPNEGASLVLGRYLSPRLYVGYGIGLMEQANSVRMRYDLTDNWQIVARSGATSSADFLYSIEVDRSIEALPALPLGDDGAASVPHPPAPGDAP